MFTIKKVVNGHDTLMEFGDKCEMSLMNIKDNNKNKQIIEKTVNENRIHMKFQEKNSFSQNVLAQKSEDVWNDI